MDDHRLLSHLAQILNTTADDLKSRLNPGHTTFWERKVLPKLIGLQDWPTVAVLCARLADYLTNPALWQLRAASAHFSAGQLLEAENILLQLVYDHNLRGFAEHLLGRIASAKGQFADAVAYLQSAAKHAQIDVALDLAYAQQQLGDLSAAADNYRRAAKHHANNANLWFNWAICVTLGRTEPLSQALSYIERACQLAPDNLKFLSWRLYIKRLLCHWKNLDDLTRDVEQRLIRHSKCPDSLHPANAPSLYQLNLLDLPPRVFRRHADIQANWQRSLAQSTSAPRKSGKRTHIAVLSSDLCGSAVGMLAIPFVEQLAKRGVRLSIFHNRAIDDPWQQRAKACASNWYDISQWPDNRVFEAIRASQADILLDLTGLTSGGRPNVVAKRPLDINISQWGFLNTAGTGIYDFITTDPWIWPPDGHTVMAEKPIMHPCGLLSCCELEHRSPQTSHKRQWGFKDTDIVIGAFHNAYKITPLWLASWLKLLAEHPNCHLWLYAPTTETRDNLCGWITQTKSDVLPRVHFAAPLPLLEHQARLQACDFFADTFGYNAGATAVGAIAAGLPILTMPGRTMLSRMGFAINQSLGFDELCQTTPSDYFALAEQWLSNTAQLKEVQVRLVEARERRRWGDVAAWTDEWLSLVRKL